MYKSVSYPNLQITLKFMHAIVLVTILDYANINTVMDIFQEFHRKYYHPSNARIWFYGDDDPAERLRILSGMLIYFMHDNLYLVQY